MKTCTLCVSILLNTLLFTTASAQNRICVFCASNLNEQPTWGPAGYDFVYYYYMPDIEVYYYVPQHQFIYQRQGAWVTSNTLPLRYATFDFYRAYKVVINDPEPYQQHESHKAYYASFKGRHDQTVNRDDQNFKELRQKNGSKHEHQKTEENNNALKQHVGGQATGDLRP